MNWRLIWQLSMFGVAMGLGIVFSLPAKIGWILWSILMLLSAYAIAKRCARLRFLNGLMAGLFGGLVMTVVEIIFFHSFVVRHPDAMALLQELTPRTSPRHLIELMSPILGLELGIVIGLVTLLVGLFVKPAMPPADAAA